MGKVWIQQDGGHIIHLPVQGDDVNTSDDSIEVPPVLMVSRCYSQPIAVVHPTYGTFTIDLMQDSGLIGSCNQCGMCCGHPVVDCPNPSGCSYILDDRIGWHVCQHLVIDKWNKWGDPSNSECDIYTNLINVYKGCLYPPLHMHLWMTGCGYSLI